MIGKTMQVTWLEVAIITFVITMIAAICGWLIRVMHKQAMDKLDAMIGKISDLSERNIEHDLKLKEGSKEFGRIEEHQKSQDMQIVNLLSESAKDKQRQALSEKEQAKLDEHLKYHDRTLTEHREELRRLSDRWHKEANETHSEVRLIKHEFDSIKKNLSDIKGH